MDLFTLMTTLVFPQCCKVLEVQGALLTTEQRLLKHVLHNHDKLVRPVTTPTQTVQAKFGIELIQLIKVDDRSQLITTKVWIRQSWSNQLLQWNASEWGGIGYLKVNPGDVWIPDIVLYDNAAGEYAGGVEKYKTQIIMYPNGQHYWLSPAVFTSTCKIDIRYFPFDKQTCTLKFGSWTYDLSGINLTSDTRDAITSQFIKSSEWHVPNVEKNVNVAYYGCCPNPYGDVTFKILLQRKPLFYVFNVIAPCLVLSLTILFGFFFPPESGERISFIITILLAIAVFMQMISGTLPVNSDGVPKLALFYMVILIESALSLGTTCIVLIFHHRSDSNEAYTMPHWLRKYFIDFLARKMGYIKHHTIGTINKVIPISELGEEMEEVEEYYKEYEKRHACKNKVFNEKWHYKRTKVKLKKENFVHVRRKGGQKLLVLKAIQTDVRKIMMGATEQQQNGKINEEWRILAKVLDKIFFGVFLLTVAISAFSIIGPAYFAHD